MRALVLLVFIVPGAIAAPTFIAVVPDLPGPGPGDEGFGIYASPPIPAGYLVSDGEGTWSLPACDGECWFTGNSTAWNAYGGPPAFEWNESRFILANKGDSITLFSPNREVADHFSWGSAGGPSLTSAGLVFRPDQFDGVTPRIHRIGESQIDRPTFDVSHVTLYTSPESTYQVLSQLIDDATERLHIHVHDFRHDKLIGGIEAAQENSPTLDVQILLDGRVPGRSYAERDEVRLSFAQIISAGASVVESEGGRYAHHHLKVMIADDSVVIQSENWNPAGAPFDGEAGNRGWGIVVHDQPFADWTDAWLADDRAAWDVQQVPVVAGPNTAQLVSPIVENQDNSMQDLYGSFQIAPIVSPDHTSNAHADPIIASINGASERIWAQQLSMSEWEANRLGWSQPDRYLAALEAAAERGVDVQVQLAAPFGFEDVDNQQVAQRLESAGATATIWDHPKIPTLHNKGWIVDDSVYIGSMNGNHASRSDNREFGVVVEDPVVADWYAARLQADQLGSSPSKWLPSSSVPMLLAVIAVVIACRPRDA